MWQTVLDKLGLKVRESDAPDREPIDFTVGDADDNVAWVWGSGDVVAVDDKEYNYDYEVECNHPAVEYGDDDEQGRCEVCGQTCYWHYEKDIVDEGHDEQGNYTCQVARVRVPDEWHEGDGGIIKQYVKEVYGRQQS